MLVWVCREEWGRAMASMSKERERMRQRVSTMNKTTKGCLVFSLFLVYMLVLDTNRSGKSVVQVRLCRVLV